MVSSNQDEAATRVLLADDDEDMRALMATSLRTGGFEVIEASDGAELLDLLVRAAEDLDDTPCVVVTDVMMPRLSGVGVLDALNRSHRRLPVILVTVVEDELVASVALKLGAMAILRKPFAMRELRTAVAQARALFDRKSPAPAQPQDALHP
jgi:DNA-binding response OmpR family regulator